MKDLLIVILGVLGAFALGVCVGSMLGLDTYGSIMIGILCSVVSGVVIACIGASSKTTNYRIEHFEGCYYPQYKHLASYYNFYDALKADVCRYKNKEDAIRYIEKFVKDLKRTKLALKAKRIEELDTDVVWRLK